MIGDKPAPMIVIRTLIVLIKDSPRIVTGSSSRDTGDWEYVRKYWMKPLCYRKHNVSSFLTNDNIVPRLEPYKTKDFFDAIRNDLGNKNVNVSSEFSILVGLPARSIGWLCSITVQNGSAEWRTPPLYSGNLSDLMSGLR